MSERNPIGDLICLISMWHLKSTLIILIIGKPRTNSDYAPNPVKHGLEALPLDGLVVDIVDCRIHPSDAFNCARFSIMEWELCRSQNHPSSVHLGRCTNQSVCRANSGSHSARNPPNFWPLIVSKPLTPAIHPLLSRASPCFVNLPALCLCSFVCVRDGRKWTIVNSFVQCV